MRPTPLSIAGVLVPASIARAQPWPMTSDSSISWTVGWTEGPGGNNDGRLEPGESAVIHLSVSFTNQNGMANFSPPFGTFGSGIIRGLGGAWLDLNGGAEAPGSWDIDPNDGYGVAFPWDDTGGGWGTIGNGSRLTNIMMGQFPPHPSGIVTTNPVNNIFTGLWTPADYTPRMVSWTVAPNPAAGQYISSLLLEAGPYALGVYVDPHNIVFGSVQIPIGVPAPGAVLMVAGVLAFGRRNRR